MKALRLLSTLGVFLLWVAPFVLGEDSTGGVLAGTLEFTAGTGAMNEIVVVYLEGISGDYEAPKRVAVMDQKDEEFVPRLLSVQKGQPVKFRNSDLFTHNVHLYRGRRSLFNIAQGIRGQNDWAAPRSGEYLVLCNIHRKMSAFILVHDHPFFTTVNPQGSTTASFKIENIPGGTYTLVSVREVERKGILQRKEQEVTIAAGKTTTVNVRF
jgi:plastocyanin